MTSTIDIRRRRATLKHFKAVRRRNAASRTTERDLIRSIFARILAGDSAASLALRLTGNGRRELGDG